MEFNIDPYYDDFKENALDNNYMKILFKPGRAVQARELTQMQSILQNQIKAFGDHVFQDGSPVIGGNMTLDNKCKWLKLERTYSTVDIDIADFEDRVIRNTSGNVQAKVLATYYPFEGEPTLMVRYVTGNEFQNGDIIKVAGETTEAQANSSNSGGLGTVVSINEGIFYADGYFVQVADQTAVVNAYSSSANVKIGLEINEEIVDSEIDTTLLDPAQSSFNYQAPGADRFQFSLVLTTRPLDTVVDESKFFELMRVENGVITKQVKYPVYAELEKTLARRTFDESGDYTVKPFRATIVNGVDDDQYTIAVEPGKAYVKGFEFETLGTMKINVDKPRSESDVKRLVETDVDISYGNYIYVTGLRGSSNGFINIAALEKVDLHCVDTATVNIGLGFNANTYVYQNTKMGTALVKNFVRHAADAFNAVNDSAGVYKLYLSDISLRPIVTKVSTGSSNANTIVLSDKFSQKDNAYVNVSVTILPIALTAVADVLVNTAIANAFTINANNSGTFTSKLSVGDVIRIGDDVREVVNVATGNVIVNTEFSRTHTFNSSIPVQVFKQTTYSSNVVNQTRNVVRYHGTSKTLFLDREFDDGAKIGGAVANGTTVVQLNFKIDQVESFIAGPVVANSLAIVSNSSMNVSGYAKYLTGETSAEDTAKQSLIFRLPRQYAKRGSLNNSDYVHNKLILNRIPTSPGSGIFEISTGTVLSTGFETLPWADSTGAIQDNLIVIVRDDGGDATVANGDVLQLDAGDITKTNDSLQIDTGLTALKAVDVLVSVKQNDAEDKIRRKIFHSNTSYDTTTYFTRGTVTGGTTTVTTAVANAYPTTTTNANTNIELRVNAANVAYGNVDVANGLVFITNVDYTTVRPGDSISLYVPDVVKVSAI
jgi:FtsZ-interacting cell division protein YlmF